MRVRVCVWAHVACWLAEAQGTLCLSVPLHHQQLVLRRLLQLLLLLPLCYSLPSPLLHPGRRSCGLLL